jgi:hypothetical protein
MKKLLTILFILCSLSTWANKIYPGGAGSGFFASDYAHPGDTIVLRSSDNTRTYFALDYLRGTAQQPIVIINEGGQVRLSLGFDLKNCHYVKLTGSGDAGTYYGFYVSNPAGVPVGISARSENVEIERVDVFNSLYGAWAKQDPSAVDSLNYPNWIMDGIHIHHCRFKKIGQDCIYAGNTTAINGQVIGGVTKYPMRLSNVNIHNLIIDSANRTGIQVGECMGGSIHDCNISSMGYEYDQSQGTGISIGGHSYDIHVYNDTVSKTFLYGIMNFGKGRNYIENNVVDSSGILYIDPSNNIDSLAKRLDTLIHATNGVWNTGFYHIRYSGRFLYNNYSQPCNIDMSPSYDLLMYPTLDSSTVVIRGNKLGQSVVVDGSWNIINGNANKINVQDQSRNPIGYGNYICSNTLMDGTTAAAAPGVPETFHYYTDCSPLDAAQRFIFHIRGRLRFKARQ